MCQTVAISPVKYIDPNSMTEIIKLKISPIQDIPDASTYCLAYNEKKLKNIRILTVSNITYNGINKRPILHLRNPYVSKTIFLIAKT